MTDWDLIDEYVSARSEAAFSRIVERHWRMVRAICRREIGDSGLAEDAAQVTFLVLARRAPYLRRKSDLESWLFATARLTAKNLVRQEERRAALQRRARELMESVPVTDAPGWPGIDPYLNDAIASLKPADRAVVLLRYFDGFSTAETAAELGIQETAARVRLNRAIDRLRDYFKRHGLFLTGAALTAILTDQAAPAAQATAAAGLAKMAVGFGSSVTGLPASSPLIELLKGVQKQMLMAKFKATAAVVCSVSVFGVGVVGVVMSNHVARAVPAEGVRALLRADLLPGQTTYNAEDVKQILEKRLTADGLTNFSVKPHGSDQFLVELPGVTKDSNVLDSLIQPGQMAFYYFKDVQCQLNEHRPIKMEVMLDADKHETYSFSISGTSPPVTFRDGAQINHDYVHLLELGSVPHAGAVRAVIPAVLMQPKRPVVFTSVERKELTDLAAEMGRWKSFIKKCPIILTNKDIEPNCQAELYPQMGEPVITQNFDAAGSAAMTAFTTKHLHEIMAVTLDDSILIAPVIQGVISGTGEASFGFKSLADAQQMAGMLNAGPLPVRLEVVQEQYMALDRFPRRV